MSGTYLYAIVKSAAKPPTAGAPAGLPGAERRVSLKAADALWLIASEVPLDVYGPESLERHLGDLDWVGRIALAHEAVVEYFARRRGAAVIPMKLFTMFSSPQRAVDEIAKRKRAIGAAMRRIAGAEEWGVRVTRAEAPHPPTHSARPSSGAAFLAAKKQARDDQRVAKAAAADAAAGVFDALAKVARESRRREHPPAGGATPPLLDAAFLVAAGRRASFTRAAGHEAARCARAGAHLTLSGPWPAYNFVQGTERA